MTVFTHVIELLFSFPCGAGKRCYRRRKKILTDSSKCCSCLSEPKLHDETWKNGQNKLSEFSENISWVLRVHGTELPCRQILRPFTCSQTPTSADDSAASMNSQFIDSVDYPRKVCGPHTFLLETSLQATLTYNQGKKAFRLPKSGHIHSSIAVYTREFLSRWLALRILESGIN